MELQLILINNQALCLHRSTLNGPVTTLKHRGEPINAVECPSEYLERVCSQLGGVSLSQLTVSLTHDQVNEQTLQNWGMALVCAERLNIGRLRARLPRPISPHEQLELTEEGISCLSGSSRQVLMSFEALGTTMSPSAPLALPSQVEAPVMSGPHPEVLERLEAIESLLKKIEKEPPKADLIKPTDENTSRCIQMFYPYARDTIIRRHLFRESDNLSFTPAFNNGDYVNYLDTIYTSPHTLEESFDLRSSFEGYIFYLGLEHFNSLEVINGNPVFTRSIKGNYKELKEKYRGLTFAVISSDPNDTLPQIKAWLAMNNIPFYQGG